VGGLTAANDELARTNPDPEPSNPPTQLHVANVGKDMINEVVKNLQI